MKLIPLLKKFKSNLNNRERLIEVMISRDNLLRNLQAYQKQYPELLFAPVLKSNAYGHGLVLVAEILDNARVPFFCIDSLYEAEKLETAGVKHELLVLGYTQPENILSSKPKKLAFAIVDIEQLRNISKHLKRPQKFHLKIDTGMHRQGIMPEQALEAVTLLKQNPKIILDGLYSHLADADNNDSSFTEEQIKQWNAAATFFRGYFAGIKFFHLANTAGAAFSKKIFANVARLGLGLYGIDPAPVSAVSLQPALSLKSVVSSLRQIRPGQGVGYNVTFKATKPLTVATIPVGYFEGVDRRLGNKGFVKIRSQFCPIVGKVNMNMISVDVSKVKNVKVRDEVIIISADPVDKNSVHHISQLCDTVPHQILSSIPQHLKRVLN